jgi:streptogramin lyase
MAASFTLSTPNTTVLDVPAPGVLSGTTGFVVNAPDRSWEPWPAPGNCGSVGSVCFGADGVLWLGGTAFGEGFSGGALWRGNAGGTWETIVPPGGFDHEARVALHPSGDVYAVCRNLDKLYVWGCATNTWTSYRAPAKNTDAIAIDTDGRVWVLFDFQSLHSFDPATQAWRVEEMPCSRVKSIAFTRWGEMIACEPTLLGERLGAIWARGRGGGWGSRIQLAADYVAAAPDGTWWAISYDDGIACHIDSDQVEERSPEYDRLYPYCITVSPQGDPWVASQRNIDPHVIGTVFACASVTKTKLGRVFWGTGGALRYLPDAGAVGVDTFVVPLKSTTTTPPVDVPIVTVEITVTQTQVRAEPGQIVTPVDTPVALTLAAENKVSATVSYAISKAPTNGTLSVPTAFANQRQRVQLYTPRAGFAGTDTFQFTSSSLGNTSTPATVTIQVVAGAPQLQWLVPALENLLVNPPGVLAGLAGATVSLPARSWRKDAADGVQVTGVGLDPTTGDLWMTGTSGGKAYAWRRSPSAKRQAYGGTSGGVTFQDPRGVAVTADSTVWIADAQAKALVRRDGPTGAWTSVTTTDAPWGVALDGQGRLHVSFPDVGAIRRYDPSAKTWTDVGGGTGAPKAPRGLATDTAGRLWVADDKGHMLCCWSGTWQSYGGPSTPTSPVAGTFNTPQGVAVGPDGKVWVADSLNARVQVLDVASTTWTALGTSGSGETDLLRPTAVVVDARGDAWVGDRMNPGLHVYAPFVAGTFGVVALRADGGMLYQARKMTGFDDVTVSFVGAAGVSQRKITFVVAGS